MHASDGTVRWAEARTVEPEKLDIRAVPDPNHHVDDELKPEMLMQGALLSEDAFRDYVSGTAKLTLLHNPEFALYSQQDEGRSAFLKRCAEEAKLRIELQQEKLESTFRRRIDQVKELSERDQRERDASDEPTESQR